MIVEVAGGDAADFGFQWQGLLGNSGDKLAGGGHQLRHRQQRPNIIASTRPAATGTHQPGRRA
jgi:general secretion pathway protein D